MTNFCAELRFAMRVHTDRHYAPARVMPLLETLRRHPNMPNVDIVVAGNDEPRLTNIPGSCSVQPAEVGEKEESAG